MTYSSIAITATAAGVATVALLVLGPLEQSHTFPVTKRKLETPPPPPVEPVAPLSASWSFVDQSTSALLEAANKVRAQDHAERVFAELVDPETYYEATRQPEFGVEVISRGSGNTRFIRKRRSRQSQGQRVVVVRKFGEDEQPGRNKSYFIKDEFKVFNTTVIVKHVLSVEDATEEGANPAVVLEVEVETRGPLASAWVIGRRYAERLAGLGGAVEGRWGGKDVLSRT
ncbi:hypothetical protein SpCBS45565_g04275 [Spizellomyces sp. 'palustris']|nr:hypothetical protein SpCBS45565_g04275 [Spizellomyces sp. 'palustris']